MTTPTALACLALLCIAAGLARLLSSAATRVGVPAILLEMAAGFFVGNWILPYSALQGMGGLIELGVASLFFAVGLNLSLRDVAAYKADV